MKSLHRYVCVDCIFISSDDPSQVLWCPFYYDCLVKRTRSMKILEEFLFLEVMMSEKAISDCNRMKETLRQFSAEFGKGYATSLLLTAMRGKVWSYDSIIGHRRLSYPPALGAVPMSCAHPPTVPDTREELACMCGVWGD